MDYYTERHPAERPSVSITGGSQHVRDEDPPDDWTPPGPVGFRPPETVTAPEPEHEPLTWDGDQS